MANRPISWDIATISCEDEGDEKRLDGEQKTFTGLSNTEAVGCGEAMSRTLVYAYN